MPEASARRAAWLLLCYLPLLSAVALAVEKRDREIRWHAKNGLLLFAAVAVVGAAATVVGLLLPSFGCLYPVVMITALVLYALITILALVKAIGGERLIVPGLSRFAR